MEKPWNSSENIEYKDITTSILSEHLGKTKYYDFSMENVNGLINSNDAVPGGYTFSRDGINLGGNTDKMVKSDNNLYGNSWPAGSSSITKTPIKNKRGRTVGYKIGS